MQPLQLYCMFQRHWQASSKILNQRIAFALHPGALPTMPSTITAGMVAMLRVPAGLPMLCSLS